MVEVLVLHNPEVIVIPRAKRRGARRLIRRSYVSPYQLPLPGILDDWRPITGITCVDGRHPEQIEPDACRRLWLAVLTYAVRAYVRDATSKRGEAVEEDAKLWILDDESNDVGSFSYVCDVLGIDVEQTRARIISMNESDRI